jgi:putative ABC transport system substrate-binding protein
MKRREFIRLLGGAAAAWPMMAHGQQPERMRRVAVLMNLAADDSEASVRIATFTKELQLLGWNDGRNVRIDYRWGAGDGDSARKNTAELLALAPEVVLAAGSPAVAALLRNADRADRIRANS